MTHLNTMTDRIVLLKRRIIEETDGSFKEHWEEGGAVWAQILPCFGREALGEGWNNLSPTQAKYKVTLRYHKGHFSRIKWENTILAMLCPPTIDQRRRWMMCLMHEIGEANE